MIPEASVWFYENLARPVLFRLTDPEKAHDAALKLGSRVANSKLASGITESLLFHRDPILETTVDGVEYRNPVGLAAGFDKIGGFIQAADCLGFGSIEVGSVTHGGGQGNPKPRLFRLPSDKAIINRMGLNGDPSSVVRDRLADMDYPLQVGVNIAKTHDPKIMGDKAIADFYGSFKDIYPLNRIAYLTINISCPNTAEGKTFEDPGALRELLAALGESRKRFDEKRRLHPVYVKVSPDLVDPENRDDYRRLDAVLEASEDFADGYIIGNTTNRRDGLATKRSIIDDIGKGGLSGKPLTERGIRMVRHVRRGMPNRTIIGAGGIFEPDDALRHIGAGADLVQAFTGFIYKGPGFAGYMNAGLAKSLRYYGFNSVGEAVGRL